MRAGEVVEGEEEVVVATRVEEEVGTLAEEGVEAVLDPNLPYPDPNRNRQADRNLRVEAAVEERRNRAQVEAVAIDPSLLRGPAEEIVRLDPEVEGIGQNRPNARAEEEAPDCRASVEEAAIVLILVQVVRTIVLVPTIARRIVRVVAGVMISLVSPAAEAGDGLAIVPVPVAGVFSALARCPIIVQEHVPEQTEVAFNGLEHFPAIGQVKAVGERNGAQVGTIVLVAVVDQVSCPAALVAAVAESNGVPVEAGIASRITPAVVEIVSRIAQVAEVMALVGRMVVRIIIPIVRRALSAQTSGRISTTITSTSGTSGSRRITSILTTSRRTG